MDRIIVEKTRLTDESGRERIFSGVNVVDKRPFTPGEQKYPFLQEDVLCRFAANGWNLIRLGFTWANIEPKIGQYNDAYIDSIANALDLCAQHGIYAILDMHQDLFSCVTNGDGAPPWATLTDGLRVHPTRFVWAEDYFWGRACHRAFDHFWSNTPIAGSGVQDRFADCWAYLVRRLGAKDAVIGFDVFNEPFPGSDGGKCFRRIIFGITKAFLGGRNIRRSELLRDVCSSERTEKMLGHVSFSFLHEATAGAEKYAALFDRTCYSPFLQKVADAIRAEGSEKILFMENNYYSNLGIPCAVQPVCREGARDAQQAFAPHAYDFMVDTPAYRYASDDRVGGIFGEHARTQKRLGVPVVVGEWGGFGAQDDETWLRHISFLLRLFDSRKWSNTYWQYSDAFLDSPLMKVFVRPFPQAVCGEIESYGFDERKKRFCLTFSQMQPGVSVIATPFPVRSLTLDKTEYPYSTIHAQTKIQTPAGQHCLEIHF